MYHSTPEPEERRLVDRVLAWSVLSIVALLALVLLLTGCSMPRAQRGEFVRSVRTLSAKPKPLPVRARDTFRTPDGAHRNTVAWTSYSVGMKPVDVQLGLALACGRDFARTACAHELGHVLGLEHGTDPRAWMYATVDWFVSLVEGPTPGELAVALRSEESWLLVPDAALPAALVEALEWAAAAWNRALGREAFTVRR